MRVAVTGASGHLGRVLVPALMAAGHEVTPIGRVLHTGTRADALIHLAAPNWRDSMAILEMYAFTACVAHWTNTTGTRVINCGSWWQSAGPQAQALEYTRLKDWQGRLFPTTLVPFSIYGEQAREGRGFIPQLQAHLRGSVSLAGVSDEPRDWIHVSDVAAAFVAALGAPDGTYDVCTGRQLSPRALALACGLTHLPEYAENPSCAPRYAHDRLPDWHPQVRVLDYLRTEQAA